MVKHTQTIRRQIVDELFECVRPFCEVAPKGFNLLDLEKFISSEPLILEYFSLTFNPQRPNLVQGEKIKLNFYFHTSL